MKNDKQNYVAPDTELTRVEIESAICGGSVELQPKEEGKQGVIVSEQEVANVTNNNFNTDAWGTKFNDQ